MKVEIQIDPACTQTKIVIHASRMTDKIEALIRQLSAPEPAMIPAQTERGIELLPVEKIIRVYTERQRVFIQTTENIHPVKYRLYEMEERLNGHSFVRTSSSELVNTKMITAMDFSLTGTIRMTLNGNVTAYVSRRYVKKIKQAIGL